jgi:molybdenum cofactor biosynthesis protein A
MGPRQLFDNHGRVLNYVRLAVTDRCNLRCFYCMPEEGVRYLPKRDLLTFEEIERLLSLLASMGITKVRLTGGEPFVRRDLMKLLGRIVSIPGISSVHMTTNGVLTAPHVAGLKQLGVASVNLSLDTLNAERFKAIARRDEFANVMETLNLLLKNDIPVKINAVVMEEKNIDDIIPLVELSRDKNISVRFIEEMPFNGEGNHYPVLTWTYKKILQHIQNHYPGLVKITDPENSTAYHYKVPGYQGDLGIIAAFSRTFCGTCNRIRISAQGELKTCLYDDGVLNIRDLIRQGKSNEEIQVVLQQAFQHRPKDGFEAEQSRKTNSPVSESMSTIGG